MKKEAILFLCIFLISINNVCAISSDLKETYRPKETIIVSLSGIILDKINLNQIRLYRGYTPVAFEGNVLNLNGKYYVWIIAPQIPENYSLAIESVLTIKNGNVVLEDYQKNFKVEGDIVDYTIKPGAVFTSRDFFIEAELNQDTPKSISINFPNSREFILNPGKNYIDFSIENVFGNQFLIVNIGSYSVPIFIIGKSQTYQNQTNQNTTNQTNQNTTNQTNQTNLTNICGNGIIERGEDCEPGIAFNRSCSFFGLEQGNVFCNPPGSLNECKYNFANCSKINNTFQSNCSLVGGICKNNCENNEERRNESCGDKVCCVPKKLISNESDEDKFLFFPKAIVGTEMANKSLTYNFFIRNLGKKNLTNISIDYNEKIFNISPKNNFFVGANGTLVFNLTIINNSRAIREVITAKINGKNQYLIIKINFTREKNNTNVYYLEEQNNLSSLLYCSQIQGIVCLAGEECKGQKVNAIENNCCLGKCEKGSAESNYSWIGYLLGAILIGVLIFIFIKYRKVKPEENPIKNVALKNPI